MDDLFQYHERRCRFTEHQAHLQQNHDSRAKVNDEFVEWEQGQIVAPSDVAEVSDIIPEVALEEPAKEFKLADMERDTIQRALLKNGGNRKATAVELGLSERTLYRKIKDYDL